MAITERGKEVGGRVKALRAALRLTQEALANNGGTLRINVVQIEHGLNQLSTLAMRNALAKGFGLSRDDFDAFIDGRITVETAKRRALKAG